MSNVTKLRNTMRYIAAASLVIMSVGGGSAFASVDVSGENNTTGPDSTNDNTYVVVDTVEIDVTNTADATTTADITADSGNNDISNNTTVDGFEGGDIEIEGEIENELNSGSVDFGSASMGDVDADFTNDTTGPNSENNNDLTVVRDTDINVENTATMDTAITADLNTGNNTVDGNTTVGDVETGSMSIDISVENTANEDASDIDLSDLIGDNDVNADFTNDTTGPNSSNNNTVTVTDSTTVNVTNDATATSTLDATLDSGNNDITNNTTVGDVKTGDQSIKWTVRNTLN